MKIANNFTNNNLFINIVEKILAGFDINQIYQDYITIKSKFISNKQTITQINLTVTKDSNDPFNFCTSLFEKVNDEWVKKCHEEEFIKINSEFSNLYSAQIYHEIKKLGFNIGRFKFVELSPKSCYSWHNDEYDRLHIPIRTNDHCGIVIDDTWYHLPADGSLYGVRTTLPHTAFNAGQTNRIHLIGCLIY